MGWKIVRDGNEDWCREHGVSGTWRTSADPVRGLARKLTEEAAEFGEALDPAELYDLLEQLLLVLGTDARPRVRNSDSERTTPISCFAGGMRAVILAFNRVACSY